ncbi:MAG TPA: glycosyltransferase family 1 protein [Edaphocola sp.]|nr:glycosyltransferase family 1 protein [Edaphocola sp.]
MRIAVNARLLLKDKLEGIGWFAHQILSRMVRHHPEHQFIFFFDRPWDDEFIFGGNVEPVLLKPQARHPFLYYIWTEGVLPRALKKYKADIYFSPDMLGCLHTKVPVVFTIHDLAYKHYPQYMDRLHRWHYGRFMPRFAQKARKIIAVSEFTKQDIVKRLRIPEEKIEVIYNGVHKAYRPLPYSEAEATRQKYTGGNEFFLFTGALHPRKNIINLLKAFVYFKRRQRSPIKLVIVGRMAWQFEEIEKARRLMPFKEDVIWTGYMGVEDLAKLTASAYALVYPSLFEGFGIPILEAMSCGVPVIVSETSSMPEVAGNAGLMVNPNQPEDIAAKMMAIYKDETLRNYLIHNALVQKKKFDWEKSAEKLWQILVEASKK